METAQEVWFGIVLLLHGMVHLMYAAQSARRFQLKPGMTWPDESWAWSRLLSDRTVRDQTTITMVLSSAIFLVGGIAVLARQTWWRPVAVVAAALSALAFILLWDGRKRNLDGQGAIGVIIDIAVLVTALVLDWPQFGT
ncbi:MAG: hypothetical protein JXA87_00130 [Thermoleophilia bacterium]|nr:hypothetical protein [Thermoleophilia bacterium]